MKCILAVLAILLIIKSNLYGQYDDTTHYHLVLNSAGSINKTDNDKAYLLNNNLNLGIKDKSVVLNATNTWVYGKQNNSLTNNDFSSTLFFNLYKTLPHFYYWGLLNYNTSYSLKINNQLLAGLGGAYSVVDKKNAYVNLSDGILFDQSDLLANKVYHTYRNSFRLQFHIAVQDLVTLNGTNYLQSSLSDGNDYIIKSTTTLGLQLRKWISLTTALNYNQVKITNSDNLIFTYGLTLDKFF